MTHGERICAKQASPLRVRTRPRTLALRQCTRRGHLTTFFVIYIRAPSAAKKARHQAHTNTNHPEQQTLDYSTVNIEKKPDSSIYLYFFSIYLPCRVLLHPRLTL